MRRQREIYSNDLKRESDGRRLMKKTHAKRDRAAATSGGAGGGSEDVLHIHDV